MSSDIRPVQLRTNALTEPLGLDDVAPEFSWQLTADTDDVVQAAYAIQVHDPDGVPVWDSGRTARDVPFGVRYAGTPLRSSCRYSWRVQVWDAVGGSGGWSEPAGFETGVLDPARWRAEWISGPQLSSTDDDDAVLYLRGELELPAPVARGRAYTSALGWYRLFVNGADLTGPALVPRWTPLDRVVEYQTYDVTEVFRAGTNTVGLAVGDGRYRGRLGVRDARRVYGDRLGAFLQVELDLTDGTSLTWTTDRGWVAGAGRITASDPKHGERVDLRVPDSDWLTSPTAPTRFRPAEVLPAHPRVLIAEEVPAVGDVRRLPATRVWRSPEGRQLVDFGQNIAGVVNVRLAGPAGSTVRLTHSEVLTTDGELDTIYIHPGRRNGPSQTDEVVLAGDEVRYQPWFTIHGFRYVQVDGLAEDVQPDDIEAVVLSSRLPEAGTFSCSDDRLNRLWANVAWSTRANFTDTATDCPTRERSGWTGDIQVFASTATGMVDVQAFLRRYLRNLALDQFEDGRVPPFIPAEISEHSLDRFTRVLGRTLANSAGWGDAAVLVPWALYQAYGDETVLERQYDSMRAWVDYMERRARTRRGLARRLSRHRAGRAERFVLDSGFHWGEWLRPGERFPTNLVEGTLHGAPVATAYFAHSASVLAQVAGVLGHHGDARRYSDLATNVTAAWQAAFVGGDGRIGTDRQDDYVRALAFDLLPVEQRPAAVARLVASVEAAGDHLQTGFLSTPLLLPTLVAAGRPDVAFRLLLQTSVPSWLHQIERGATTVWETWEGHDDKGRAEASHNHYAFGAVAGWLREGLLGVTAAAPGYRHIRVAPVVGGGITAAGGTVATPFGTIEVDWRVDGDTGRLAVTVPAGTTAEVHLPDGQQHAVGSGRHTHSWVVSAADRPAQTGSGQPGPER